jgi:hypothetical protein
MDYRQLLQVDRDYNGGVRDNDEGFEGSQGAYLINEEGSCILCITKPRRVIMPRFEADAQKSSGFVDRLLWSAASLRAGGVPGAAPGCLVASLRGQLGDVDLVKLYAKPGTVAWERVVSEAGGLPLVEALGLWDESWALGGSVVLGLPHPEFLGVSWQPDLGGEGMLVFPRFVAAAWVSGRS